uniref:Homeobox domain-containing protein n=1 Tax=Strongyloides papillosus TaxID=174720 RepID=A0A0N5BC72_STREA
MRVYNSLHCISFSGDMSSNNSTMVNGVAIKVIIKPTFGLMDVRYSHLSELAIEKTITPNPRTLVKDLCKSVMEGYNLGHVSDDFKAFIRHSNLEFYPFRTFFHDMKSPISSVAVVFEDILTIKIFIPKNLFFECYNTITINGVYESFIKYMISELSDNRNQSLNFASVPRDSSSSPGSVGSDVFKDCIDALDLIIGDGSGTTSSQESQEEVQLGGRPKKRIKYNKEIELPILELLYTRSDTHDFEQYASGLNALSGRTGSDRLTPRKISSWFKRRRARDRRNQRLSMEEF